MKKYFILSTISLAAFVVGCKKEVKLPVQLDGGSINVTNAIIGGPLLNMMSDNAIIVDYNQISNGNSYIMPVANGNRTLKFGTPAVAATSTTPAVPAAIYYTQSLTVDKSSNYSLFLTGTSTSAIDNILIKESYPFAYADSLCAVRFINLATGSNPISVNLQGSTKGSEVTSLAYKAYSGFKKYPAKRVNASYTFEFRDATTGKLVASYYLQTPYFHNVTLCLTGNGNIIQDNDY